MVSLLARTEERTVTHCQVVDLKFPLQGRVVNVCPVAGGILLAEFPLLPASFSLPNC